MNIRSRNLAVPFLLAALLAPLCAQELKRTYAIRIDGRVVGYQIETERPDTHDGHAVVRFETRGLTKVEILGASINQVIDQVWILDPKSRAVLHAKTRLEAGETKVEVEGQLEATGFKLADGKTLDPERVVLSPEFRWLERRGPARAGEDVTLDYFMPEMGSVTPVTVRLAPEHEREIDVLGKKTPVRVYDMDLGAMGVSFRVFVGRSGWETIRYEMPAAKMVVDLVPESVVERIERVDMTSTILVKTNLDVEDPAVLTFVRLRARIATGMDITAEALNGPGQRFEGTVQKGRIDGVFEIRPRRFDGTGAPAFPVPEAFFAKALQPFLQREDSIESDDAALAAKARELAAGATSCFQVLERLAKWTHENISYSIPGGMTAKRTFELRSGECGGHSRVLAAMLRSVGIPARTPMGGMYVPLYGGSFGQHMWTEVHLGDDIGWVPVDCTAGQATFIDAGHIRLADGETSFRPESIEVLDHEPKAKAEAPAPRRTDAWPYTAGEALTYSYTVAGRAIGEEQVTYEGKADGGHVFTTILSLGKGGFVETTKTVVGDDGRLLTFHVDRKQGEVKTAFDVRVAGNKATVEVKSSEGDRTDVVDVEPEIFPLHNNCTAHFAIPMARLGPLAEGAEAKIRLLHHEQRSVFAMTLSAGGLEEITLGGKATPARVFQASLVGLALTVHVDEQGRLLRWHQKQGDVTIERKAP